ncbi:MAG TPA: DNA-binding response regulator [Microscillaceae bacterium]|jgi:two-component system LytT family response regulator|nr:DNA-binding response regulator [Microscillaceae bacterium]
MNIVLVEDEPKQRSFVKQIIETYTPYTIIGEAGSVSEGEALLKTKSPDLVLMDIEMPDGTGFDLLKKLGDDINFQVIFITAHNAFAIQAFKFSALDYLLKPLDPEDLTQALQKAQKNIQQNQIQLQLATLMNNIQDFAGHVKKLVLKDADNIYVVASSDIYYLEADSNYTTFFLVDGSKILISKTLKEYEQLLEGQGFFRCHQSFLINLAYLARVDKRDGGMVILKNEAAIPLASRKKDLLLKTLERLS